MTIVQQHQQQQQHDNNKARCAHAVVHFFIHIPFETAPQKYIVLYACVLFNHTLILKLIFC